MTSVPLGPAFRTEALERMAEKEFDVLVVGGGVVGTGVALDAVSRGLSVALVEACDWAAGTSSRSSKLIHGGLRYLEQLDFRLVREALKERGLLLTRLAPHLVRPVPFLFPLRRRVWERLYVGAGIALYDLLDSGRTLPRHRHLSRRGALAAAPSLSPDALVGAVRYFDAQVDDARFAMTLARTAAQYGAAVATRARVTGLLRDGDRVTGARVRDLIGEREIEVRARQVINATGVWTDETGTMARGEPGPAGRAGLRVRASKGVHITVPRDRITLRTGLILRTEKSVLFTIPWGRHWIIGTTDTDWALDKTHPVASRADIDYLLDHVNRVLSTPLTHDDIDGVYTGLRPLLAGDASDTAKLSREHTVARPAPGLVVIAGGKYTTYRVMARDAVDVAARELGETGPAPAAVPASALAPASVPTPALAPASVPAPASAPASVPASVTDRLPLLGAEGYEALRNGRGRLAARAGLDVARVEHLLGRYGSAVTDLLDLVEADPRLGEPITGAAGYLRAEALYAASHEGALGLEDVLVRRTRVSIEERDRGLAAAPEVAELIAPVLGWDEEDVRREVEHYRTMVHAEMSAELQPDDRAAVAARAEVCDRAGPLAGGAPVTA